MPVPVGCRGEPSSHLAAAADRAAVEPFTGLPQRRSMDTETDQEETSSSSIRTFTVEIEKSPRELHNEIVNQPGFREVFRSLFPDGSLHEALAEPPAEPMGDQEGGSLANQSMDTGTNQEESWKTSDDYGFSEANQPMHTGTDQEESWTSEDDSRFVTVEVEKRRWIGKRPLDLFNPADEPVHEAAAELAVPIPLSLKEEERLRKNRARCARAPFRKNNSNPYAFKYEDVDRWTRATNALVDAERKSRSKSSMTSKSSKSSKSCASCSSDMASLQLDRVWEFFGVI
jgi:hypothetical protein